MERLKLQQDYNLSLKQQDLAQQKQRSTYLIIALSLAIAILVLLIIISYYKSRITKNTLEKELLQARQNELKRGLDSKNQLLIAKAMAEIHREETVVAILKDLKLVKRKAIKKETREALNQIEDKLNRNLNTDLWQEFEVSFEQVHPSFFKNLTTIHPGLTPKDRRLCSLLYLDLSSKEIALITGQSFKAIENSRTRLRKKLELTNTKISISSYLYGLTAPKNP